MRAVAAIALVLAAAAAPARADSPAECKARGGAWRTDPDAGTGCMIKGKRDGAWELRFPSGQLEKRESWALGLRQGPAVRFHATCQIAEKGGWDHGERDGDWATWLATGQHDTEGPYRAGRRQGVWRFFREGVKVAEGPFVDDSADGEMTEWFTTAVKWRTVMMKAGEYQTEDARACVAGGGEWEVDYKAREEGCKTPGGDAAGWWHGYATDGTLAWRTTFKSGLESGEHVDYHPTGEILRRAAYVDGVPDGVHEFRARDGKPYGRSTITKGSGAWKAWFADGTLEEDGAYLDGRKHGAWKTYSPKGRIIEETTWEHGLWNGPHREYYPTGEVMIDGANLANNRDGVWFAFYSNGKIAWTGGYDLDGQRTGFWYNGTWAGNPEAVGPMVADRRAGMWLLYHPDGALAGAGPYVGGMKNGAWIEWWPSGERWRVVNYVDDVEDNPEAAACDEAGGVWFADPQQRALGCQMCRSEHEDADGAILKIKHGAWRWWHPNGALEKQGTLVADAREGAWKFWFDNGQVMLAGEFRGDQETGRWQGNYRDGTPRFDGGYRDGAPDGEWTSFHPDGSTAATGRYATGKKVGGWTYFHPGGGKKENGEYADGEPVGPWTSYHPNGAKESAGSYVAGKREGTWTWWRADGSEWRTTTFTAGVEAGMPARVPQPVPAVTPDAGP